MSAIDAGRESGFRWPLTAIIQQYEDGSQTFGLADLSTERAFIETKDAVEVRR